MVRRRYPDGKKVLLVDPAHDSGRVQCGGTLGGLSRTRAWLIMHAWQWLPCRRDRGRKYRVARRIFARHTGWRNDLLCPTAFPCCHVKFVVAGMCPKSGGFLLPYWLGPAGCSLPTNLPTTARREPT